MGGCAITSFINRNSGAGKSDRLSGTVTLLAYFQPSFPKLLSTGNTKGWHLPVPKCIEKGKTLALTFVQVNPPKQLKTGTCLQITDLRKR